MQKTALAERIPILRIQIALAEHQGAPERSCSMRVRPHDALAHMRPCAVDEAAETGSRSHDFPSEYATSQHRSVTCGRIERVGQSRVPKEAERAQVCNE